jgi:hypothetical protein
MSSLAILTVGTGTAGKSSNLAQGLVNTVDLLRPRAFWLVPSHSEASISVADLVAEGVSEDLLTAFRPWDVEAGLTYRCIEEPDDLELCRQAVREVIRRARRELREDEKLIINPVSGTKQMSAGATLAALDEEIGDIQFTIGDRADGVVVTGTERLKSFDASRYFEERDLATAEALFQAGAFWPAARILQNGGSPLTKVARAKALCLHEWQRLNHRAAAQHAEKFSAELARRLESLASAPSISLELLRDILAGADELFRWGDSDEALARYYRGTELAAKVLLADAFGIRALGGGADGYAWKDIEALLPGDHSLATELRTRMRNGRVYLGLDLAWRLLAALGHSAGASFVANGRLRGLLDKRNEGFYGHGDRSASRDEVERLRTELRSLLETHYPVAAVWSAASRPATLREP